MLLEEDDRLLNSGLAGTKSYVGYFDPDLVGVCDIIKNKSKLFRFLDKYRVSSLII